MFYRFTVGSKSSKNYKEERTADVRGMAPGTEEAWEWFNKNVVPKEVKDLPKDWYYIKEPKIVK